MNKRTDEQGTRNDEGKRKSSIPNVHIKESTRGFEKVRV
jgi:hypothetical protein